MKKVHIVVPGPQRALRRVKDALIHHAPADVEFVSRAKNADLVVLNVIGRQDKMRHVAEETLIRGGRYAVIQYCLRSTLRPSTVGWVPLWVNAETVWSYLDLSLAIRQDGGSKVPWDFYYAPLGADPGVFRKQRRKRTYVICTSGSGALSESVKEAIVAARRVNRKVAHLGPELNREGVDCFSGLTDSELVDLYNQCEFVAGLRRTEGFELPAAEGLLCGARPIMFDQPHYRQWYAPWAEFITEGDRSSVIDSLEALFRREVRFVTDKERATAANFFDWRPTVAEFWRRCLST